MPQRRQPPRGAARHLRLLAAAALAAATTFGATAEPREAFAAVCSSIKAKPSAALCLINAERSSHGLRALRLHPRLSKAARAHSRDMVGRRYFSHTTPEGVGFVERIRGTGYLEASREWLVGENIAWGSHGRGSARRIVQAWMNSPPHREEILRPSFRDVGIGVASGVPRPLTSGGATYTVDFGVKH